LVVVVATAVMSTVVLAEQLGNCGLRGRVE
jgi:hypothetical protein